MPWKLIGIILLIVLVGVFVGYNTSQISIFLGPLELKEVRVFEAMLAAFLLGVFITLPFTLISASRKGKLKEEKKKADRDKSKKKKILTTQKKELISENNNAPPEEQDNTVV